MEEVVLVTGGSGLVGKALAREVLTMATLNVDRKIKVRFKFTFVSSREADLTDLKQTSSLFELHKPSYVINLAAKVGGLFANMSNNDLFFRVNQAINNNVLRCASEYRVKKCISCLSTCIFPDKIEYPLEETKIYLGPPHRSNYGYSLAKRQVALLNDHYNRMNPNSLFTAVIPTNVYGPEDNFNLESAHVVPGLIHKAYLCAVEALTFNKKVAILTVCGTGKPVRQLIYAQNLARLILWCLLYYNDEEPLILCPDESEELSIDDIAKEVARIMSQQLGVEIKVVYDSKLSDGQLKKTASNRKFRKLNHEFTFTPFQEGLTETIKWFCDSYPMVRK